MITHSRHLIFALIVASSGSADFAVQAEVLEAQWEVHQIRFRYKGFSTYYTCDGVERTLKRLLKLIGARGDVRVESKCINRNTIQQYHKILLAFAMPVPADKTDISREIIPAEWREVRIVGNLSRYLDAGDCELLEQFQRQVLPHLQVRETNKKLNCVPFRRQYNNLRFRMSALKALEKTKLEDREGQTQSETRQSEK